MLRRYGQYRGEGEGRKRQFVISTEDRDRHNTVIKSDAWELDSFAGAAFYQHNSHTSDPDDALGPARVWREGNQLVGEIDFEPAEINPKADKILKKIDNGTLKNASVGFLAHDGHYEGEEGDRHFVFTRAELMEFSVVGVPSNREAKVRQAEVKEFEDTINSISQAIEEGTRMGATVKGEDLALFIKEGSFGDDRQKWIDDQVRAELEFSKSL